jgi:hypothetical protein
MPQVPLYDRARDWEKAARDERDSYPYIRLLNELSFQAELRYSDYLQYRDDGLFLTRLQHWLDNVPQAKHQQALFRLLSHLIFIDELQMTALYRDAFRRVIAPWLFDVVPEIDDLLRADTPDRQRQFLMDYQIVSITESFSMSRLLAANDLHGITRPIVLGQKKTHLLAQISDLPATLKGLVVCEDIVGTGKQAGKVLRALESAIPPAWRVLFVPLITFEEGIENIHKTYPTRADIQPVVVIPRRCCLKREPQEQEPFLFKLIRGLARNLAARVLEPDSQFDDPPKDAFGYQGTGGLIVTCHNSPNNTLPLIHHKAPTWNPLFRRVHHKERAS